MPLFQSSRAVRSCRTRLSSCSADAILIATSITAPSALTITPAVNSETGDNKQPVISAALIHTRIQLVEGSNGEGQIGASGYYPSYEYYNKGWHVAPTNNQDNHKGKWGNANDARDVILTDDFSEEGIYAAIRAMRMYATEGKNLEIGYTVNDQMMGSIIEEVPESLKLGISSVECATSTPVTGEEPAITTTLFNSESTGGTIPASGTAAVEFKYIPDVAKVMTVTVTDVVEVKSVEYTFSMDVELDVQDASKLV